MKQKIKMFNDQHSQNWLFEEPVDMTCLSAEIHQEKKSKNKEYQE